jgi:peroxiredoxin
LTQTDRGTRSKIASRTDHNIAEAGAWASANEFSAALRSRKFQEAHRRALQHAYDEAGVTGVPMTDSVTGTLVNYRGHYTVVHFWASWCSVGMQQLPALHRVHDQYASRDVTVLGLSLDEDATSWKAALARLERPWHEGRLAAGFHAGISSVPAYFVVDPAGKIVAKVNDPDEAAKVLAERLR